MAAPREAVQAVLQVTPTGLVTREVKVATVVVVLVPMVTQAIQVAPFPMQPVEEPVVPGARAVAVQILVAMAVEVLAVTVEPVATVVMASAVLMVLEII